MTEFQHIPVLLHECIDALNIRPNGVYVDMTCGGGGHSSEIAKRLGKGGRLICFDQDSDAIEASKRRLSPFSCVTFFNENFKDAKSTLMRAGITKVDGILADLGVSSYQIDTAERGFSFLHDGTLDMRMNRNQTKSAYDVVNGYTQTQLRDIIFKYGEESFAPKIAEAIVKARQTAPIETTLQLKEIIERVFPKKIIYGKGGVSKKTFQAIRIEVNGELDILSQAVEDFVDLLAPSGRLAVISFHSLEDRIIKNVLKDATTDCICPPKTPICICNHRAKGKLINKKPITASAEELQHNDRSHSAKLRVFERF